VRISAEAQNTVDDRPKNYRTEAEIADFLKAARKVRHGIRNYAMLLLAFRHGLRVSEVINIADARY
jgi:type 1 fimbriae regulatory protein FimB